MNRAVQQERHDLDRARWHDYVCAALCGVTSVFTGVFMNPKERVTYAVSVANLMVEAERERWASVPTPTTNSGSPDAL